MCSDTLKAGEDAVNISLVLALPEAYLFDPIHDGFQELPSPSQTAIGFLFKPREHEIIHQKTVSTSHWLGYFSLWEI